MGGDTINKQQKEIMQVQLNNEKAVLKKLEQNYADALAEIDDKIAILLGRQDADMQHVIYQVEYQRALKTQIQAILETLQANEFETVSEYLTQSYEDGFIGTMYDLQGQGIPLIFPINQTQVIQAIQQETKLSESLYTAMGKDITDLRKKITGEISRGISNGATYAEIARNVSNWARIPKNNAMRIVRTESHRITEKAARNVQKKAEERGAEVKKIWDATLDHKTRRSHAKLDGEIRDIDEEFSNGLLYPGDPNGKAEEVINCRCRSRTEATWALEADHTKMLGDTSKMSEEQLNMIADKLHISVDELKQYSGQIIPVKAKNYEDFKRQYNKLWRYEGSKLQEEAEARIAGYKAKGSKKADYLMRTHKGATDVTNERIVANKAIAKTPEKVQNAIHDGTIVDVGKNGASQYDYNNDILYIAKNAEEEDVLHEIGHMMENKLMDSAKVEKLRKSIVGTPSIADLRNEIYYDSSGNPREVFMINSDKFISDYQGRIYVDDIWEAFNEDGSFKDELLWEFVSEPCREYLMNPENLKAKCPEMYELIKEVVE